MVVSSQEFQAWLMDVEKVLSARTPSIIVSIAQHPCLFELYSEGLSPKQAVEVCDNEDAEYARIGT